MVPIRVSNVFNEVFHLAAETMITLAKAVIGVISLELNEVNH